MFLPQNCCTIPYEIRILEDTAVGTLLGTVVATDKDIGENANIQYFILSEYVSHVSNITLLTMSCFFNFKAE